MCNEINCSVGRALIKPDKASTCLLRDESVYEPPITLKASYDSHLDIVRSASVHLYKVKQDSAQVLACLRSITRQLLSGPIRILTWMVSSYIAIISEVYNLY